MMSLLTIAGKAPAPTLHTWYAKPPWVASVDQTELRGSILADARAATGLLVAPYSEGGTLPVLVGATWFIEVNTYLKREAVYFDAWNGSERVIFWVDASEVRDLLARIGWKCSRCSCGGVPIDYGPDPYAAEILDDPTPVLLCLDCIELQKDEI